MARTTKPLTNTEVKLAKGKPKEYSLADGNGLSMRVKPNGSKLWIFNYSRPHTEKRANISLGVFPNLTLAEARITAPKYKGLLTKNIDPKQHRIEEERQNHSAHLQTFERVAIKWLTLKNKSISESYYKKISSRLDLHVFPYIGNIPLFKINAPETIEILESLAAQGKLETISNICGWLNEIMVYSVNSGLVHANPLSGIRKAFTQPTTVNLPTLKPEQLPELMMKLSRANIKIVTRCLLEWQLHPMVRPGEAAGVRWVEIDIEKKEWVIPE